MSTAKRKTTIRWSTALPSDRRQGGSTTTMSCSSLASRWDSSRTDRDALADPAQQFVGYRARECGDALDGEARPPQYDRITERCCARQIRDIDSDHVHRYPPGKAC